MKLIVQRSQLVYPGAIRVSATKGTGIDELRALYDEFHTATGPMASLEVA